MFGRAKIYFVCETQARICAEPPEDAFGDDEGEGGDAAGGGGDAGLGPRAFHYRQEWRIRIRDSLPVDIFQTENI